MIKYEKKQNKSIKHGTRFKPCVYEMLREIAKVKNTSMSQMIEELICEQYKEIKWLKECS